MPDHEEQGNQVQMILELILQDMVVNPASPRYSSTDQMAMNGITVGGTKYMFLSANERVVRARKGQSGVHCIKTVQGTTAILLRERTQNFKSVKVWTFHIFSQIMSTICCI